MKKVKQNLLMTGLATFFLGILTMAAITSIPKTEPVYHTYFCHGQDHMTYANITNYTINNGVMKLRMKQLTDDNVVEHTIITAPGCALWKQEKAFTSKEEMNTAFKVLEVLFN